MELIRVGVVDGSPVTVMGMTAAVNGQPDMHVVAAGATVDRVTAPGFPLDVVLIEVEPGGGAALRTSLRSLSRLRARIVAVASRRGQVPEHDVRAAGAVALVHKSEETSVIVRVVREAARGDGEGRGVPRDEVPLTAREAEVLTLYSSGRTAEQVASKLYISSETVHDHIRRVRAKYAAAERAAPTKVDLFRRAMEDGLLDDRAGADAGPGRWVTVQDFSQPRR